MGLLLLIAIGYILIRMFGGGKTLREQWHIWRWIIGAFLLVWLIIVVLALLGPSLGG